MDKLIEEMLDHSPPLQIEQIILELLSDERFYPETISDELRQLRQEMEQYLARVHPWYVGSKGDKTP